MDVEILQWAMGVAATASVVAGTIKTMMSPPNSGGEPASFTHPISCSFCSQDAIGHDERGRSVCERHSVRVVEPNPHSKTIPQPPPQARMLPAQATQQARLVDPHDVATVRDRHQIAPRREPLTRRDYRDDF